MSFPKKGRNFRPISGKSFPNLHTKMAASGDYNIATVIAETLRQTFGGTHAAVKTVVAFTGACERTVKNWFEGKNAPNGENLVELARHSDEILEVFLLMADRGDVLSAKKLVDARDKLIEMLEIIDQLQGNDITESADQD
jgi:hypothetical protein